MKSLAQLIDHTLLKPGILVPDIKNLCAEAIQYGFASVCAPPYFVSEVAAILSRSDVKTCTVIGFPFGYSHYEAKLVEAKKAAADGADELDIVINTTALKNGNHSYLEEEIGTLTDGLKEKKVLIKIIIESGLLSNAEIKTCCALYQRYPVHFLKTSTGYAEKGASVEAVRLMRQELPSHIEVKASGGIRNYEFAKALVDAGASRLGCSASIAIIQGGTGAAGY